MEEKETYTHEEVKEMLFAYQKYEEANQRYLSLEGDDISSLGKEIFKKREKSCREEIDKEFENCKEKIPKSLINKLGIKSISEFFGHKK